MDQARYRQRRFRWSLAGLALGFGAVIAGCEGGSSGGIGTFIGTSSGFFGAVSADEPQAAQVGRDLLNGGGNAVDAAVAMYFALSVTMPSAASLGSNGVCLVNSYDKKNIEAITFSSSALPGSGGGTSPVAIPTAVRGMTLLHVKYGKLRWEQIVAYGERLARPPGAPVSRALARDLRAGAALIGVDPEARRVYDKGGGVAYTEGDVFPQGDLAGTLGAIRLRGGQDFFAGTTSREIVRGYNEGGAHLTLEALRDAKPSAATPPSVPMGSHGVYFAPTPYAGGATQSAWQSGGSVGAAGAGHEGGAAGFVALDRDGNGVACNVGMGQLFGARRMAPTTGIMMAAATGRDQEVLGPIMIANRNTNDVLFVGAASGSAIAPAAIGSAAAQIMKGNQPVGQVVQASPAVLNIIACSVGARQDRSRCSTATDSKGFGLALVADAKR